MAFVKGKSGNPSGRPKVPNEVRELARKNSVKAINRLVKLIDSEDEKVAIQASNSILDRAWGKPAQAITGEDGGPIAINLVIKSKTYEPLDDSGD